MTEELKTAPEITAITIHRGEATNTYTLGEDVHVIVVCSRDRESPADESEDQKSDADAVVSGHINALGALLDEMLARNPAVLAAALRAKLERTVRETPRVILAKPGSTH